MSLRSISIMIVGVILSLNVFGQSEPTTFDNPILPGYHPDPSICRVGDDYYLINSTFLWFPGIPVYHSNDLVNWELIGHVINRPEQMDFTGLPDKLGVFAPTIRYHEGLFYVINTCVGCGMNFYVTASNPAGPWSDPVWLPEAPGIDPSLMWDDDGKCYYTGMTGVEEQKWSGQSVIYNQELDLEQKKLVGERHELTFGHANNASYSEGPHLYKINGKYLLMISEGGTGLYHSLTVHHSDSINGPYVADYINPVITHRNLGLDYPLHAIGHGDLVQTQNGEWWSVLLGKRKIDRITTLARETFLAKVEFEGQTPIFNPGYGKVLMKQTRPNLPWSPVKKEPVRDQFEGEKLGLKWCTIRTPKENFYSVKNGKLKLKLRKEVMDSLVNPSILIQRIEHHKFEAMTKMSFKTSKANEQAGLTFYRTNENHYNLLKDKNSLILIKSFKGKKTEIARIPFKSKDVYLHVEANDLEVQFSYGESPKSLKPIGEKQSLVVIADGQGNAMFNGPGIGVYATSNGLESKNQALFEWFEYDRK
ncbi:glycoside hydrolase family 43 protein [Ancylomarina sp. 16SWW S1-10-2]|uniref:glycoside hydrolase family 43 protein n=1 Tax=Ancylomarina sp. 16SWW S1-10-2 TaxID=2499681 RepID=UPI0012ADCDAD|nr:glycoside hydrolase family 43 protein [Ancylomarina sp. 16SWW S1-10-2]MRT92806.1 glycoside hydrolase family 43 protein [Ancylomarina sp. 16SWW S1-10-2]